MSTDTVPPKSTFDALYKNRQETIAASQADLVGQTPMVYLSDRINKTKAKIAIKLESENPMSSVKDRLGLSLIRGMEADGIITPGKSTLIEATSGNTGISLAQLGNILGYKVIITMPETMSTERRALIRILGAELILTPAAKGLKGALATAEKIVKERPDTHMMHQFKSKYNMVAHYHTTGPEVFRQTQGKLDYFVMGVGTGGTVSGVAKYLKEQGSKCKFVAVEPAESAVLSGEKPGPHKIQGMGAGFIPDVMQVDQMDEIIKITSDDAAETGRQLPRLEGIWGGISTGAIVTAALQIAARPEAEGKLIVAVAPSFGERYLSHPMFNAIKEEAASLPVVPVTEYDF